MNSVSNKIAIAALLVCFTVVADTVEAVRVTRTSGGNESVVFFDDFENVPAASVPLSVTGTWSQNNNHET